MDIKKLGIYFAALIPLFELYVARSIYRARDLYGDQIFMIGLLVGGYILVLAYRQMGISRLQIGPAITNALALTIYGSRSFSVPIHNEWIGLLWVVITVSAACLFFPPSRLIKYFRENLHVPVLAAIIYASLLFLYCIQHLLVVKKAVWYNFLAGPTTDIIRAILEGLGYEMMQAWRRYVLKSPDLTLLVYTPCSGMEGVVFFIVIFSCLMMMDFRRYPLKKIVLSYLAGIVMMLAVNILRITFFFMFGVWAVQKWGPDEGSQFVMDLFHNNVGWIFYATAIGLFFTWFYKKPKGDAKAPPLEQK